MDQSAPRFRGFFHHGYVRYSKVQRVKHLQFLVLQHTMFVSRNMFLPHCVLNYWLLSIVLAGTQPHGHISEVVARQSRVPTKWISMGFMGSMYVYTCIYIYIYIYTHACVCHLEHLTTILTPVLWSSFLHTFVEYMNSHKYSDYLLCRGIFTTSFRRTMTSSSGSMLMPSFTIKASALKRR